VKEMLEIKKKPRIELSKLKGWFLQNNVNTFNVWWKELQDSPRRKYANLSFDFDAFMLNILLYFDFEHINEVIDKALNPDEEE